MCTYDNTQAEDQFDWLRNAGATSSWRTGPSVDHTLGTALGMKKGKKNKPLALIKKNCHTYVGQKHAGPLPDHTGVLLSKEK